MMVFDTDAGTVTRIRGYQLSLRLTAGDVFTANGYRFLLLDDPRPLFSVLTVMVLSTERRMLPPGCPNGEHEWVHTAAMVAPSTNDPRTGPAPAEYRQERGRCTHCGRIRY